jgi:cytochrome c oxidase subunit 2
MSKTKRCPECGVSIKNKNYKRHLKNVHAMLQSHDDFNANRISKSISQRRKTDYMVVGIVLVIIIVIASFGILYEPSEQNNDDVEINSVQDQNVKEIKIDAERFNFSPDVIELEKGKKVRLVINNQDTLHGIVIPDLGVNGNNNIEFTPNETGTFPFYCSNYCGNGHSGMSGSIIVK